MHHDYSDTTQRIRAGVTDGNREGSAPLPGAGSGAGMVAAKRSNMWG